jgi:hypothetical protein
VCVSDLLRVITSYECIIGHQIETPILTSSVVTHTRDNTVLLNISVVAC